MDVCTSIGVLLLAVAKYKRRFVTFNPTGNTGYLQLSNLIGLEVFNSSLIESSHIESCKSAENKHAPKLRNLSGSPYSPATRFQQSPLHKPSPVVSLPHMPCLVQPMPVGEEYSHMPTRIPPCGIGLAPRVGTSTGTRVRKPARILRGHGKKMTYRSVAFLAQLGAA